MKNWASLLINRQFSHKCKLPRFCPSHSRLCNPGRDQGQYLRRLKQQNPFKKLQSQRKPPAIRHQRLLPNLQPGSSHSQNPFSNHMTGGLQIRLNPMSHLQPRRLL